MNFHKHLTEDRRLVLLRLLADAPGYAANESILLEAVESFGHRPSRDALRADLAWLAEQGLVTIEEVATVMIATVTRRGGDVAFGRAVVPGVRRPEPGR
jgi:hypothetical protein